VVNIRDVSIEWSKDLYKKVVHKNKNVRRMRSMVPIFKGIGDTKERGFMNELQEKF